MSTSITSGGNLNFVVAIWVTRDTVRRYAACLCGFAATERFISTSVLDFGLVDNEVNKTGYIESLQLEFSYLCQIHQFFLDLKDKSNSKLVFCSDKSWENWKLTSLETKWYIWQNNLTATLSLTWHYKIKMNKLGFKHWITYDQSALSLTVADWRMASDLFLAYFRYI